MERYDSYKNSGIEWIGEIPVHWDLNRVGRNTYVKGRIGWKGLKSDEYLDEGEYFLITGTDFKNGTIDWNNANYIDKERYEEDGFITLSKGDVLITKDGTIGKIAYVDHLPKPATLNSGVFITRPLNKEYSPRFFYWVLNSYIFESFVNFNSGGSTILHLYQNVFVNFHFPLPKIDEQQAIVSYLDTKTAQIDHLIQLKERKIELLKEKRTALINHVVTKGLDPDVEMKDSGVEWIGEIPANWNVNQIKRGLVLLTDYDANGSFSTIKENVNRVESDDAKFAWMVRATDLEQKKNIDPASDEIVWVDESTHKFLSKSSLVGGELLIAKRGEIGKVYLMPQVHFPATLGPNMYLARLNSKVIISKFAFYYFTVDLGRNQLKIRDKSTTIGALYKDDFKDITIIYPTLSEQQAIVSYLDNYTTEIDSLIQLEQSKIELLKEYRQSLISEVVTGKIRVCEEDLSEVANQTHVA